MLSTTAANYLRNLWLALFGGDGRQRASVAQGDCRHLGNRRGDLWTWHDHVELGQLRRILGDVPPGEGIRHVLLDVLRVEMWHYSWMFHFSWFYCEVQLTLMKGVCLVYLPLSCLPTLAGRQTCSTELCVLLLSTPSIVPESLWRVSAFFSASLQV